MARELFYVLLLVCQCAAQACPANPCQPWREDTVGGLKVGGGSCSIGEAWDLRFAYGSFECDDPNGVCCGTNTYGTNKQEECSAAAPVPGPGPGPVPGPTPSPTPPTGQCVKPLCGASTACKCYGVQQSEYLFYYVNPTETTTEPTGYVLGLASTFSLAETTTPTITLSDGSGTVLQEVAVTGGMCSPAQTCQTPGTSCPTTFWVKTTSVEVCNNAVRTASVQQNTDDKCNTDGTTAPQCVGYRTHSFCPKVDQFQQFRLAGSAKILNASSRREPIELLAWNSGKGYDRPEKQPYEVRFPTADMYSRMPIYVANHSDCPGNGAAIATVLLYNVTLRSGKFGYKNAQPIGNGFTPTCDGPGMKCKFDSKKVCIGKSFGTDPGQTHYNCGQCLSTWDKQLEELDIQIFVSYYGTDPSGRTLTSGSSNPINFRQFADADVYDDVWNSARNFKPPSLNPFSTP